ncbi:MAG: GAF domain-containing protein [Desulfobacca sp.]|nr:GAF domain-containing protein [Desulfobacca sp.]
MRLIWVTKKRPAWILIAAAISLMTFRRGITLYHAIFWDLPLDRTAELVALGISGLMLVGIAWIAPLFLSLKSSEEELRLNESRLQALWQLSHMTGASLQEISDFALEEGVRLTKSKIGFVGFMNEDETVLNVQSWSKTVMEQCAVVDKPIVYLLETAGLWAEAVRQRQPIIINDYAAPNPNKKGYPEGHIKLQRLLTIPVFDDNRIVAVASVANKQVKYDDADVRQLTLLMNGMWWHIQRQRAEQALTHEIERMHQFQAKLIQTSNDGIIANDRNGNIIIFNDGAERILGYSAEEIIGKLTVHRLYPPKVARKITKMIYDSAYGGPGRLVQYETEVISKAGELIPIELSACLIFEDHRKVATVGFFRDLRERKQLQEKILQSERLAVLGRMAAHVSHEIKNPLMIIGGFARQVRDNLEPDQQKNREKLQIVIEETRQLEDFLAEVGSYAKISEPHKNRGDLNLLIQETCRLLEPGLREGNIKLVLDLDSQLPMAQFDPVHLRRVLLNITKNGIEAMPRGGTLTIASGQQPGRLFVHISDTGKGIPPDVMEKIFTPFFSTKPKGSGLGLTISQQIIAAHQGEIAIETELHKGTRVTIFLRAD